MKISKECEEKIVKHQITNFVSDNWDFETTAFKEKVKITLPRKLAILYEENSCPLNDTACSYYADLFGLDETSDPGLVASAVSKAITEELLVLCDKEKILAMARESGVCV